MLSRKDIDKNMNWNPHYYAKNQMNKKNQINQVFLGKNHWI